MKDKRKDVRLMIRVGDSLAQQIDRMMQEVADREGGVSPGRSTVVRRLIVAGIPALRRELSRGAEPTG